MWSDLILGGVNNGTIVKTLNVVSDGTIDTTRVWHFGQPTERQIEVYTAMLQGCINLASTVFPAGQTMQQLDVIIRRPLYQLGLEYGHGSTHGTGVYLGVHEGRLKLMLKM